MKTTPNLAYAASDRARRLQHELRAREHRGQGRMAVTARLRDEAMAAAYEAKYRRESVDDRATRQALNDLFERPRKR